MLKFRPPFPAAQTYIHTPCNACNACNARVISGCNGYSGRNGWGRETCVTDGVAVAAPRCAWLPSLRKPSTSMPTSGCMRSKRQQPAQRPARVLLAVHRGARAWASKLALSPPPHRGRRVNRDRVFDRMRPAAAASQPGARAARVLGNAAACQVTRRPTWRAGAVCRSCRVAVACVACRLPTWRVGCCSSSLVGHVSCRPASPRQAACRALGETGPRAE